MGTTTKIGVATATIVGMNAMIGAGIFSAPATLASTAGSVAIFTYIFVMFAVWFTALSLSRVAELFPEEGSFYTYAKQWGGHIAGVVAGGAYIIGLLVAMGLLAQIAGVYLSTHLFLSPKTLGLTLLAILVLANLFGARLSQAGQIILICCTILPIIVTSIMCLTKAHIANIGSFDTLNLTNIMIATKSVIFGFFGFEAAASLFSIVKDPKKNVPRALTFSIIIVGLLYLLFICSIIFATPAVLFSTPKILLSTILFDLFPHHVWVVTVIHFAVLSAIVGTLHSMIWSASSLTTSFAHKLGITISAKVAVAFVGICIGLTCIYLNNINLFFSITACCLVTAYSLAMITLLFIPKEWKSGRNIITVCGLITAAAMLIFAVQGILTAA